MATWKMYAVTGIEIIFFLAIGFFLTEKVLSNVYEHAGIAYSGNIGVVWFGVSFILFCLYTLLRTYIFAKNSPLLNERITSLTFWVVFICSVYFVVSPFIRGEI